MGQAKKRGTLDQRKAKSIERDKLEMMSSRELIRRKPSKKNVALMGLIASMINKT